MKYLQIITVDNEYFSINLDQQICITISADDTKVCFFSNKFNLVFTTNKNFLNEILINQDTMDLLQDAITEEASVFTVPDMD